MEDVKEALRNIWRRKARATLTIFGVAIGVFALTTMGSLALYFNQTLDSVLDYYSSRVAVTAAGGGSTEHGGSLSSVGPQIPASLTDQIKVIDGVALAYPTISLAANPEDTGASFSAPAMIFAYSPEAAKNDPKKLKVAVGHDLVESERGKVVIGSTVANSEKLHVGDRVDLYDRQFEVIGIFERTNGAVDSFYRMHLDDAQPLLQETAPFNLNATNLVTSIQVIPKPGVSGDELAKTLKAKIPGIAATPPETFKRQVQQGFQVFNLIVLGSALIAVIVGGLSVINTMVMSVAERRKEIGIKRVVGARSRHILVEIVTETAIMSLIGGAIGCVLGYILTAVVNGRTKDSGLELFLFSPALVLGSLVFALGLGVVAGIYPAWRATRIKPVKVLREA